ncbi:MAG: glucose-1-phosphate adenylyltransferase [Oscillospiraceae bacterium]|nr:glucose-1-phosphate adenylyltransferase [Oscillospiraceae bacterium]MBQ1578015.1 glucose-1-phosphate adenylyltransferase [Oscillospiraceae bacterium]MBQ1792698.1 glucose-1-phosphate adenylyltransferase [Oscillospiraceae bacterium]MBQ2070740.1 glucose-1-phosphate adenylyltransferase [Oscillospiraceae bacterium]MBQ2158860.1 glucose-1-phosphate adenylyltransferase [Oscillospiraceae bacterium]
MQMKKSCIAMLLAGGQGSRLYALTQDVAKPSVPFGGKYRIIDFPLSNCANSGIDTVGVLTQYRPLQLNSYIGTGQPWDLDVSDGGVFILPPYQKQDEKGSWFTGTANAIYQNIAFIENYNPENVLILSGDHIYKMDYADMLREHLAHDAALTISVQQVSMEEATRMGMMNVGEDGYVYEFEEKPKHPKSDLASMGVYIFNWEKLRAYLIADENNPNSHKDFGKDIIPAMLNNGEKLWPYRFDGYWRDVGTITSLWDANMDMLSTTLINLYDPSWPISSRSPVLPPSYTGEDAKVVHSIVTEGCEIDGHVENSVLSASVTVERGAKVVYSVLMPGAVVKAGATVEYAIIGENVVIEPGAVVGSAPDGTDGWGVTTCGPNVSIAAGKVIPAGAMIYSGEEG